MQRTKTVSIKKAVLIEPPNVQVVDPGYNSPGDVRFSKDKETILFSVSRMSRLRTSIEEIKEEFNLKACKPEFIGISMAKLFSAAKNARKLAGLPANIPKALFYRYLFADMQHLWTHRMNDAASVTSYCDGLALSGLRGLAKKIYYLEYKAEASGSLVNFNIEIIYDLGVSIMSTLHCMFYDYIASRRANGRSSRQPNESREYSNAIAGCVFMYDLIGRKIPDLTPKKISAKSSGKITVGCDPEFLITEKDHDTKEIMVDRGAMPAEDVFEGVMLGCDGHAETAEIRPTFSDNPAIVTNCIGELIKKAAVRIPSDYAIEVGGGFRDSIGGHIHLGNDVLRKLSSVGALRPLTSILDEFLYFPMKTSMSGGTRCWSELNIFNGEPSFDLEDAPGFKRYSSTPREMVEAVKGARVSKAASFAEYEMPSALRTKNWGIEYRSLPSFIADKRLTYLTLKLTQRIARWFLGASENGEELKFSMPPSKEDYMRFLTDKEASDLLEYFYGDKRHVFVMDAREGWGAKPDATIKSIFHILGQNFFSEQNFFPIREEIDILAQIDSKRWHKLFDEAKVPGIQLIVNHGNGSIPSRHIRDKIICSGFIVRGNTLWYQRDCSNKPNDKPGLDRARIMHKIGLSNILGRFGDIRHPEYNTTTAVVLGKDDGGEPAWMERNLKMMFFALGISLEAVIRNEAQRKEGMTLLKNIATRKDTVMDKDFMVAIKIPSLVNKEKKAREPATSKLQATHVVDDMWAEASASSGNMSVTSTAFDPLTSARMHEHLGDEDEEEPCMCDECRYDRGEIDADGDEI